MADPLKWFTPEAEAAPTLPLESDDISEQWFSQYEENLLLTVQAIQRLHLALDARFP